MTAGDWVQIIGALTGLVGASAGGLGVWLAYRARTHSLRDAIYTSQLDLLREIIRDVYAAMAVAAETTALVQVPPGALVDGRPPTEVLAQRRSETGPIMMRYAEASARAQTLLPSRTVQALAELFAPIHRCYAGCSTPLEADAALAMMRVSFAALVEATRRDFGVDALSEEMLSQLRASGIARMEVKS